MRRVVFALALLVSCNSTPQPVLPRELVVNNGTTIPVQLVVNNTVVRTADARTQIAVPRSELPPLPWLVEARTTTGRVLSSMTVSAGDVTESAGAAKGDALRVDLSCGRIDVWAGPPIDGPSPGRGKPGDCDP